MCQVSDSKENVKGGGDGQSRPVRGLASEAYWGGPQEVTDNMTRTGPRHFLFSSPGSGATLTATGYTIPTETQLPAISM